VELPHHHTQLQLKQVTLHRLRPVTLHPPLTQPLPQVTPSPLTQSQVMGIKLKNPTIVQSRSFISIKFKTINQLLKTNLLIIRSWFKS
jgi:hypothetical protein